MKERDMVENYINLEVKEIIVAEHRIQCYRIREKTDPKKGYKTCFYSSSTTGKLLLESKKINHYHQVVEERHQCRYRRI